LRMAASSFSSKRLKLRPARITSPALGGSKVPMICRRVLFPEPEGPTIASDCPPLNSREIPLRTERGVDRSGESNRLVRLLTLSNCSADDIKVIVFFSAQSGSYQRHLRRGQQPFKSRTLAILRRCSA